jgi:iron-sulfur cluster repair protein YtfE (RIC family)
MVYMSARTPRDQRERVQQIDDLPKEDQMLLPSPRRQPEGERLSADAARARILEQHRHLRTMFEAGLDYILLALRGKGISTDDLAALLARTNQAFQRHLADEEMLVLPILNDDVPVGPWRAQALLQEHQRQRAELNSLTQVERPCSMDELAARYGALIRELLLDMEKEEQELITPDVLRDDGVVIDQSCG